MFSWCYKLILYIIGWKPLSNDTFDKLHQNKRALFIYPHTSKWDSVIFGLYFAAYPKQFRNTYTLFAARFFRWRPLAYLLKSFNCISIENKKRNQGQLQHLISFLECKESFQLFLSPKGSSEACPWRRGYLALAKQLNCPIVVCGLDYHEKIPVIVATVSDLSEKECQEHIRSIHSLYPKNEPQIYST